jgi:hypothetical protein
VPHPGTSVILAIEIAAAVVVALGLVATLLRVRKLRRDEMRELSRPVERRLISPPPSPYAPSKGFRLIDDDGEPLHRPPVERPRLDPERHYVFSESTTGTEDVVGAHRRHNDDWFLSRSSHRSTTSIMLRRAAVTLLVALVVAVVVTYYFDHRSPPSSGTTTTTTTRQPSASGALVHPVTVPAESGAGERAVLRSMATSYTARVTQTSSPTWVI